MKIGITERGDAGLMYSKLDFSDFDGAILITKAPSELSVKLEESPPTIPYIVHATITGFGGSAIEPNVHDYEFEILAYEKLVYSLGPERVVLRIDPIIPTIKGTQTASKVAEHALGRVRVSFIDKYPHVVKRFERAGLTLPPAWSFHAPKETRTASYKEIGIASGVEPEVCGEPEFTCTGCVSLRDLQAMELFVDNAGPYGSQRPDCACLASKTEMLTHRGQCAHGCLYCYWK